MAKYLDKTGTQRLVNKTKDYVNSLVDGMVLHDAQGASTTEQTLLDNYYTKSQTAKIDLSNVTYPQITAGSTTTGSGDRVIEQYVSSDGKTWYRKWASGWKECSGIIDAGGNDKVTVTLPLSFSNTYYSVVYAGTYGEITSTNAPNYQSFEARPLTANTCSVYRWSVERRYYAFGF